MAVSEVMVSRCRTDPATARACSSGLVASTAAVVHGEVMASRCTDPATDPATAQAMAPAAVAHGEVLSGDGPALSAPLDQSG